MCHKTTCPNDGKPTWWGCGHHIESALAGVPESERCQCPHEPIWGVPLFYRVKKRDDGGAGTKADEGGEVGGVGAQS